MELIVGSWASLVVIRSDRLVGPLKGWEDAASAEQPLGDGWMLTRFDDDDVAEQGDELLEGLFAATSFPVLSAYLIDSDQLDVAGLSGQHGRWRSLAPPSAELPLALADRFAGEPIPAGCLPPGEAASAATTWALDAGRSPDQNVLLELFSDADTEIFSGERAIGRLLTGLGFVLAG